MESQLHVALTLLSTEELERLLAASAAPNSELDAETVEQILRILAARDPAPQPDTAQLWGKFQTYYNTPDGKGERLYPSALPSNPPRRREKRPVLRRLVLVAACIAAMFVVLTAVQASERNVHGANARWNDERLKFCRTSDVTYYDRDYEPVGEVQEAVAECSWLPPQLAPTALPEGYEVQTLYGSYRVSGVSVRCIKENSILLMELKEYITPKDVDRNYIRKNAGDVELYTCNGREFYVFTADQHWIAAWSDAKYGITIRGTDKADVLSAVNAIPAIVDEP